MREIGLDDLGDHVDELLYLLGVGGVGEVLDAIELNGEIGENGFADLEVDFWGGEDALVFDPPFNAEVVEDVGGQL